MIIFFRDAVTIGGKPRISWTDDSDQDRPAFQLPSSVEVRTSHLIIHTQGERVAVPFANIRYWRENYDHSNGTAEQEVRSGVGQVLRQEEKAEDGEA